MVACYGEGLLERVQRLCHRSHRLGLRELILGQALEDDGDTGYASLAFPNMAFGPGEVTFGHTRQMPLIADFVS
jgi:hypothetical protein